MLVPAKSGSASGMDEGSVAFLPTAGYKSKDKAVANARHNG
jgi:hypothetical protein